MEAAMYHDVGGWLYPPDKTLENIEYAKALYHEQKYKVKKEKYIQDVLLENYVDKIRERKSRYDYLDIYSKAQEEQGLTLKKNRPHFETVKRFLMEDFLDNDRHFKLKKITSCGYENYAWQFEFTGYDQTIHITVPYMRNINSKNVEYAHYGMFAFHIQESEHVWRMLKGSYEISEIDGTIKDYIKIWTGEGNKPEGSLEGNGRDDGLR